MLTRFLSYHVLSVRSVVLICLVDVIQFLFEDAEIFNLASSSPAGSALPAFLLLSIYRNQHQHQLCHNHDINYMLERWSSRTFELLFYMIIDLQVLDLDLTICQLFSSCLKPKAMLYHFTKCQVLSPSTIQTMIIIGNHFEG